MPMRPNSASSGNTYPQGRSAKLTLRCGCTRKLATVMATTHTASAGHTLFAAMRARLCTSPSVFSATHSAPCTVSASTAATAISSVYQSRMPASSGTPRTTLPSAAPKNTASSPLASANIASHSGCHTRLCT